MGTSLMQLGPAARAQAIAQIQGEGPKRSKYGNRKTPYKSRQGFKRTYDSALEARHAAQFDLGIETGLIKWWLPQVPFPLPGKNRKYRADFLVIWADGRVSVIDAKGADTQMSKLKRDQVAELFGVEVELVRK